MSLAIQHDRTGHRFVVDVDGHRCLLEYDLVGRVMTIVHTGVPTAVGGRGIAAELTRMALETARAEGWKVIPACSYAAAYVRQHQEYADLMA